MSNSFTDPATLPAHSSGVRPIHEAHLTAALRSNDWRARALIKILFTSGGIVQQGTVTVDGGSIRVQNRLAISPSLDQAYWIENEAVSLASIADGVRCLITLAPNLVTESVVISGFSPDPDLPAEDITHTLGVRQGILTVVPGNTSDYPLLPTNHLEVARVIKSGSMSLDSTTVTRAGVRTDTEAIQDAVGLMAAGSIVYVDGTPLLTLAGDEVDPGVNKVYGTDELGVKGWKDDPAGGGGGGTARHLARLVNAANQTMTTDTFINVAFPTSASLLGSDITVPGASPWQVITLNPGWYRFDFDSLAHGSYLTPLHYTRIVRDSDNTELCRGASYGAPVASTGYFLMKTLMTLNLTEATAVRFQAYLSATIPRLAPSDGNTLTTLIVEKIN